MKFYPQISRMTQMGKKKSVQSADFPFRTLHSEIRGSQFSRLFSGIQFGLGDFGVRRQSGSGDGAFGRMRNKLDANDFRACLCVMAKRLRDVCALPESECSGAPDAASSSATCRGRWRSCVPGWFRPKGTTGN